jgi:hypothetical protein
MRERFGQSCFRTRTGATTAAAAAAVSVAVAALACAGGSAFALRVPAAPRCPVFPKTNPWNQRVDRLPVARSSAAIIASIGTGTGLHADFGSGLWEGSPIGIPFDVVTRKTPRSRVSFEYADESDRVGYPIPKRVHIEGGSDHHALLLDRNACRLYELGGLERRGGRWHAWAGATWSLRSNRLRPAGWTSADAAGLPIFPGLARYDEVRRGVIDHACDSRCNGRGGPMCTPLGTMRATSPSRTCLRWACACG